MPLADQLNQAAILILRHILEPVFPAFGLAALGDNWHTTAPFDDNSFRPAQNDRRGDAYETFHIHDRCFLSCADRLRLNVASPG